MTHRDHRLYFLHRSPWIAVSFLMLAIPAFVIANNDHLAYFFSQKLESQIVSGWSRALNRNLLKADIPIGTADHSQEQACLAHDEDVMDEATALRIFESSQGCVGKVLFQRQDNSLGWCTGTLVESQNTVVTAAHCLLDTQGRWNKNVVYVHRYGQQDQKIIGASCMAVPKAWGNFGGNEVFKYDVGFLKLTDELDVAPLQLVKIPERFSPVVKVGYSDQHQNGESLLYGVTIAIQENEAEYRSDGDTFGPGSSGNPWIIEDGALISLSSHFHNSHREEMIGPVFSELSLHGLEYVKNGCSHDYNWHAARN